MSVLFTPLPLRGLTFKNRIFVSPMCQYSATIDGLPTPWHLVHLGSRAVGGAALVMVEATAVSPRGRISPRDTGLWSAEQVEAFRPIAAFIKEQGAVAGVQLAHAGRKGSTAPPWEGAAPIPPGQGGWQPLAPSAIPFTRAHTVPHALSVDEIDGIVEQFIHASRNALAAGFDIVEIHMAHGYLLHEFLSPLSNHRSDDYGGGLEGRAGLPLRVARAVREVWPADRPVFARMSASDWAEGGWDLAQSVVLAKWLKEAGIDLIDCSSGGLVADAPVPVSPGYQVPFAAAIREQAQVRTGAVGLITEPVQAEQILAHGQADVLFLARELLRDPYWPLHAAAALRVDVPWPAQYLRARPR